MKKRPVSAATKAAFAIAGVLALTQAAWADDVTYRFSGFGTLGVAKTDQDGTEFRQNVDQYNGADKSLDLGVDSRIALQGTAAYKDFAFTGQLLGNRRLGEEFKVGFEWIYAQYTGVPGLDLKLGRVALPAFLVSDSRRVGYAVPWLRVPTLVYAMMPLSNVDGGQATYRHSIGSAILSGQVTSGNAKTKFGSTQAGVNLGPPFGVVYPNSDTDIQTRDILAFNAMLEWGDWTARLSQVKGDVNFAATATLPFGQVTRVLFFEDTFQEAGLQYDNGQVVVVAEYVKRKTDPMVQTADAWYVGGGYRFGSVMPYAVVSRYKTKEQLDTPVLPPDATGLALGVRWDLAANLALKGEWAQYKNSGPYAFTNAATPDVANKKINVLSVALDFVF
ncbi:MAG: hypothetical protein EOP38_09845 [Rubrivivax sp.]|nr:MAG: hypothetical protein EOP38_09845 [Rubrivivax sp.]